MFANQSAFHNSPQWPSVHASSYSNMPRIYAINYDRSLRENAVYQSVTFQGFGYIRFGLYEVRNDTLMR